KDLSEHADYIEDLTFACPRVDTPPPIGSVPWDSSSLEAIHPFDLPGSRTFRRAIASLPQFVARLWHAIGGADVVHAHVAGWPLPDGWVTVPLGRLRRKLVIVNVESTFWRIRQGENPSLKRKIQSVVYEALNRICINLAHVAFFTHETYMETLLFHSRRDRGH